MDPFTIALATFGIQKLRGKSTNSALRDAAIAGGIGQFAGMAGVGQGTMGSFAPQAFGQSAANKVAGDTLMQQLGNTTAVSGIKSLVGRPAMSAEKVSMMTPEEIAKTGLSKAQLMEGAGFRGLSPGAQLGIGLGATSLLGEDEEQKLPEGTRPEDYRKAKEQGFRDRCAGCGSRLCDELWAVGTGLHLLRVLVLVGRKTEMIKRPEVQA